MWQTGGGAKQSTRRGGPVLTEESQTEHELLRMECTSSCVMLSTTAETSTTTTSTLYVSIAILW